MGGAGRLSGPGLLSDQRVRSSESQPTRYISTMSIKAIPRWATVLIFAACCSVLLALVIFIAVATKNLLIIVPSTLSAIYLALLAASATVFPDLK